MHSLSLRSLLVRATLALAATCTALAGHAADVDAVLRTEAATGKSVDTLIVLRAKAPKSLLSNAGSYLERRRALVEMLRATADVTQADLRGWLDAQGVPYRPFWITNAIQAQLTPAQLEALAARSDVEAIGSNAAIALRLPAPEETASLPLAPDAIEWGVNKIKAPQVWARGINGAGVVIAGQDTGIRWTHTAIKGKYRGWDAVNQVADHNYNWHDSIHSANASCPADSPQPCDDDSHGSHTIGTMVGDDGGSNQVGVAPGAKWIGCRNMNAGNGTPATYNECAQWLLAPTDLAGANPDPDKAPDVISNSWGCPASEGCTAIAGTEIRTAIENLIAGGIMFVASAGNEGSSCSTIGSAPGTLDNVFTIGSTTSADAMSTFSSRGPVAAGPGTGASNKPDVVAPGSSVRSITNASDTAYGSKSGTSMAAPHAAGAVALMMQLHPGLKGNPAAVAALLRSTAVPLTSSTQTCGGIAPTTFPNPVQGYGQIDLVAAFDKAEKIFADNFEAPVR
ncbi:S8 family serine peptidase [Tahibacter caeni]|uniref:S8 family serine peptidase n=1 Tax=Tahibacter caeni TaxID=1453545 RepID=UPI0021490DF7|nr:S8 family serine peptidase [Tahibacter caeni]